MSIYYAELKDSMDGTRNREFSDNQSAIQFYKDEHGDNLQAVIYDGDNLEVVYEG